MSATNAVALGYQGLLYYTTAARATWASSPAGGIYVGTPPSLTRVGAVRNVKEGWQRDKPDVTTRDQGGFKAFAASLLNVPLDFDLVVNRADAGQLAIIAALMAGLANVPEPSTAGTVTFGVSGGTNSYSGNTTIALAMLDGDKGTSGSFGVWGDFIVTKMEKVSDLQNAVVYNVTADPGPTLIPPQLVEVM